MAPEEIIIADLRQCQPASALSATFATGCWRLVDYETDDGLTGVMVLARPESEAPELELHLPVQGVYKIFLGINYAKSELGDHLHHLPWSMYGNLEIKLSDDPGFTRVAAEQLISGEEEGGADRSRFGGGKRRFRMIQETYWRTVRLEQHSLLFRPPEPPYNGPDLGGVANLSYVRLVPLTAKDEMLWRQTQPREETRRLMQIYCTGALSGHLDGTAEFHPTSLDWFRQEIQPCLNSDIAIFTVEAIRGNYCCYPTAIGDVGTDDGHWPEEWVDPLAAFTQLAHEHDLKIFAALRMIGAVYPSIVKPIGWARHFWQHIEWAKRDRDGMPTTSLSLAFPEVRAYWLSLLREVLNYDVDGITIYLHRFHPFVLYEQPVIESFRAQYGEDPRQIPSDDPRWLQHSADYVTGFLREVRRLVNEKPGRMLAVTFWGGPTRFDPNHDYDPLRYSTDVTTWIEEGLVDYLFPMAKVNVELVRRLSALSQGRVHIWPDLMPRAQPGEEFAKLARRYYDAGADGLCFNDGERRTPRLSEWAVERSLGHRELLDVLEREAPSYYRAVPIKYLMGFNTRYSFNNFGGDP